MKITVVDQNTKYPNLFNRVEVKNRNCKVCNNRFQYTAKMVDNKCCPNCQTWVDLFMEDFRYGNGVVINRKHYKLSNNNMLNFGGNKVRIEYSDGRVVESELTQELTIPENFLESFPDTAVLVNV